MPPPNDSYLNPYREAVTKHGPGFAATLWGTEAAQKLRFDVFQNMAGFDGCSLLDAGCGQGDMAAHYLKSGVALNRYHGVDALPEMVEKAIARNLPRCTFATADLVNDSSIWSHADADYICFSGTLNTMNDDMARGLIHAAFTAAHQGVIFNFLSDRPHPRWHDRDLTPARRFSTLDWLDWSFTLSSRVCFAQDYLDGHDATILIRADGS